MQKWARWKFTSVPDIFNCGRALIRADGVKHLGNVIACWFGRAFRAIGPLGPFEETVAPASASRNAGLELIVTASAMLLGKASTAKIAGRQT